MADYKGLPVAGYTDQPAWKVNLVNKNKAMEEQILRQIDTLKFEEADGRWLSIARTHIEQGFMALNRAVFRPERVKLDGE